jgi:hypothetical protein
METFELEIKQAGRKYADSVKIIFTFFRLLIISIKPDSSLCKGIQSSVISSYGFARSPAPHVG